MTKQTKCIYCGLTLRGKGCPYSPTKTHIHPTVNKCIYCGLTLRGRGCVYSPSGVHMRFTDFGAIQNENANDTMVLTYIMERINTPFTKMKAYELEIIDKDGIQLREPETLAEKSHFTAIDKYICRLKRMIGEKSEMLNTDLFIEGAFKSVLDQEDLSIEDYTEMYEKQQTLKHKLAKAHEEYYNCLKEAQDAGLSSSIIDKTIAEVLNEKISEQI